MARWADLEAAEPELAATVRRLLVDDAERPPLVATVRDGAAPRIHPVNVGVADGRLWSFVGPSAKLRDLVADGRYALHGWIDPVRPVEVSVRGRATLVDDRERRATIGAAWAFTPDEAYLLFELDVESAAIGSRESADDWPPQYRRWSATEAG